MEHALKEKLYKIDTDTDSGDSLQGLSGFIITNNDNYLLASKPQDFENDSLQHRQKGIL